MGIGGGMGERQLKHKSSRLLEEYYQHTVNIFTFSVRLVRTVLLRCPLPTTYQHTLYSHGQHCSCALKVL